MGKMKRAKPSEVAVKVPLEQDLESVKFAKSKNRNKIRPRKDEDEQFVDSKISRKILSAAREQQRELNPSTVEPGFSGFKTTKLGNRPDSDSEDEDTLEPDTFYEDIQIDEEDERAMEMFMSSNPAPRRTLADIIMEKITEKQTELDTHFSDAGSLQMQELDPKVRETFENVAEVLKIYRSGPLPKVFKFVPVCANWQQILHCTDPPSWSAAAMYQATRIFSSNLKELEAQRFYSLVLLPRIRDDLAEYKRLNFHLYQALRQALYKPGAFMKGIVLPLLDSGNCTLREAIIVGSVVARNSVPIFHSSTAICKIAEMDYTGANSIFLRILFDKKYHLPFRVVDAVVEHFIRFTHDKRQLPVLWHQALLTFVQRYKNAISLEQRDALLELLKKQTHDSITPEVRRELQNARCKDDNCSDAKMELVE